MAGIGTIILGLFLADMAQANAVSTLARKPDLHGFFYLAAACFVFGIGSVALQKWALLPTVAISAFAGFMMGVGAVQNAPFPMNVSGLLYSIMLVMPLIAYISWRRASRAQSAGKKKRRG